MRLIIKNREERKKKWEKIEIFIHNNNVELH